MGVGGYLKEHASGLGAAMTATTDVALSIHNRSQDAAFERRRKAFALPPIQMDENILFTRPKPDGSGGIDFYIIKFQFIIPGLLAEEGKALEITKFAIKSSFEASIIKHYNIKNETEVGIHGKVGIFAALGGVGIDVTNKLTAEYGGEDKQHNTFDVELEMGTGKPPLAYMLITKSIANAIDKVIEYATSQGLDNPQTISDSEAEKMSEEAKVPIEDIRIGEELEEDSDDKGSKASTGSTGGGRRSKAASDSGE